MKEHITIANITIEERHNCFDGIASDDVEDKFLVIINGRTSAVSSGNMWGELTSAKTFEEALEKAKNEIIEHNIWCDSWYDSKTGKSYRKHEKYITKATLNGKPIIIDESENLNRWFE